MTDNTPWLDAERHLSVADGLMATLITKHGPCLLTPGSEHFSQLCGSIISQQLATKAADAIFGRFSAFYGLQPSPTEVAATPPEKLRELGLSSQKTLYILDLAAKVLNGQLSLNHFTDQSDQEVINQLITVKGIGVWTAQMFLIFALNRPDVLPVDDFGLRKAIMLRYALPAMPTKDEMEAIAKPWRPWRSIASWYLWRSLDNA